MTQGVAHTFHPQHRCPLRVPLRPAAAEPKHRWPEARCQVAFAQAAQVPPRNHTLVYVRCGQSHFPCGTGPDNADFRPRLQFPDRKDTWIGGDGSPGNVRTIGKLQLTSVCLGFFGLRFSKATYRPGRKQIFPPRENSRDTESLLFPKRPEKQNIVKTGTEIAKVKTHEEALVLCFILFSRFKKTTKPTNFFF